MRDVQVGGSIYFLCALSKFVLDLSVVFERREKSISKRERHCLVHCRLL